MARLPPSLATQLSAFGANTGLYSLTGEGAAVSFVAPAVVPLRVTGSDLEAGGRRAQKKKGSRSAAAQRPPFFFCAACSSLGDAGGWAAHQASAEHAVVSARVGRAAVAFFRVALNFSLLPLPVQHRIWMLLPVDTRLLCSGVCRAWRAGLADTNLWIHLDLSGLDDVTRLDVCAPAVKKAGGRLQFLDVSSAGPEEDFDDDVDRDILALVMDAAQSNASTLAHVRVCGWHYTSEGVQSLLRALPALRTLEIDVRSLDVPDARAMLRNAPPFAPLRVRSLLMARTPRGAPASGLPDAFLVASFVADLVNHPSVERLELNAAALASPKTVEKLVDAAIALRLRGLTLVDCSLTQGAVPQLTRLLEAGYLEELSIKMEWDVTAVFHNDDDTARFCAAVKGSALKALNMGSSSVAKFGPARASIREAQTFVKRRRLASTPRVRSHRFSDDEEFDEEDALLRSRSYSADEGEEEGEEEEEEEDEEDEEW